MGIDASFRSVCQIELEASHLRMCKNTEKGYIWLALGFGWIYEASRWYIKGNGLYTRTYVSVRSYAWRGSLAAISKRSFPADPVSFLILSTDLLSADPLDLAITSYASSIQVHDSIVYYSEIPTWSFQFFLRFFSSFTVRFMYVCGWLFLLFGFFTS